MPINTTQSQKELLASFLSPTQKLSITGSIQDVHTRQSIGIDIRKFFAPTRSGPDKQWLPTKKGIWLDLDQLQRLVAMLISNSEAIPGNITNAREYINADILNFLAPDKERINKLS